VVTNDNFHFVWKRVSGDFALQAAVEWLGTNGNAHRKAASSCAKISALIPRTSTSAVHGDGLTSFQFRETPAGLTP